MDPKYSRNKFQKAKKRFGSETNLSKNSVSEGAHRRLTLYGPSAFSYSNEDLMKSMDDLQCEVISQRNLDARMKDVNRRHESLNTREAATKRVLISVLDAMTVIKQNEEKMIRKLASQLEMSPGDYNHKIGRGLKSSERRMKQLQYHMMRLEQLEEQYKLKAEMRQGAQKLIESLATSGGSARGAKKDAFDQISLLSNEMSEIEAKIETEYLGKWKFTVDSLVGCALLMPGDDFKVKITFGSQKWKTKCRIRKQPPPNMQTTQEWSSLEGVFFPVIGGRFVIRVKSVKGVLKLQSELGQVILGSEHLYSQEENWETIAITRSGALKLKFSTKWSWLIEDEDYVPPFSAVDQLLQDDESGSFCQSGSIGTGSDLVKTEAGSSNGAGRGNESLKSEHSNEGIPANRILVALHNVTLCLDQVYGHFAQLHNFEKQIRRLVQTLFANNERFSNIHFTSPQYLNLKQPEDTRSTVSSGSDEPRRFSSSVTGNRDIDHLLLTHLYACLPLFKYLDYQLPLERKKNGALESLGFHGAVFEKILKFLGSRTAVQLFADGFVEDLIPELGDSEQLKVFWDLIDKQTIYLAPVGSVIRQLDRQYRHKYSQRFGSDVLAFSFELAAERLVGERSRDDKTNNISVFTFYQILSREYESSIEIYVDKIIQEVSLNSTLSDPNLQAVDFPRVVSSFAGQIPHKEVWKQISLLLSECQTTQPDLADKILDYFDEVNDVVVRKKIIDVFLEQLEGTDSKDICAAAVALMSLRASNCLHQLGFLANHHEKSSVRGICRDAASSFGKQGRNVVQFYANPINHLTQTQKKYKPRRTFHASSETNVVLDVDEIVYL